MRKLSDPPGIGPESISESVLQLFLMDVPFLTDKSAIHGVTKTCGLQSFIKKHYQRLAA